MMETFWLLSLNIICAFLNHEVHDGREEKQEERQELLVLILRYFSFLRALRELRSATRLQPKAERPEKSDTMRIDRD